MRILDTLRFLLLFLLSLALSLPLWGCGGEADRPPEAPGANGSSEGEETSSKASEKASEGEDAMDSLHTMELEIAGERLTVEWEDSPSVKALRALCAQGPLEIPLSMYGGFEQVGALGKKLPQVDVELTTAPGDVMLYTGDKIVLFYGSNTWVYTHLGRIVGRTEEELASLLGNGDVKLRIFLSEGEGDA